MADDFTERFQYGLGDLPAEPDDFNPLYPPGGPSSMGMPPVITAGFRLPVRRPAPAGPYPGPEWPASPNRAPQLPDWWKTLGSVLQHYPDMMSAFVSGGRRFGGGGGGRRDDDGDECSRRYEDELDQCADRPEEFRPDCKKRATSRWDMCNRNGGRPSPDEPPRWGRRDEETSYYPRKFPR
jgi:hypothetical protein